MKVEVKICGLGRPQDARIAEEAGADYLGVVFAASPRKRSEREARRIWQGTSVKRVGVFVDAPEDQVQIRARRLGLAVVQLHGAEDPEYCWRLSEAGDWDVWKAVRPRVKGELETALERYSRVVDGLLVEGWSASNHGGVGARLDWSWVASVRDAWPVDLRLVLAGGLDAANVAQAVEQVRPTVVDVSSGVESAPGIKNPNAVLDFVQAVRNALP